MDVDGALLPLREILTDLPQLTGAACIGRHEMFDPVIGNGNQYRRQEQIRLAEAARLCAGCPVIQRCTSVTVAVTVADVRNFQTPRPSMPPPPGVLPLAK
ncbi:MAG TPA: hypothetical protein VHY21_17680 [Pseudonocardiaceae bacterium]|nr:hypothetical protein [Pseudonocardiaceae bacterium]